MATIRAGSVALGSLAVVAAFVCVVLLVVYAGFDHEPVMRTRLIGWLRVVQIVFIVQVVYNLALNPTQWRRYPLFKWVVGIAVLVTAIPLCYPHPAHPWVPWLAKLIYSNAFSYSIIGVYAMVEISLAMVRILGKRTNPSLMLSCSFLFFIILGSFLLMMPRCVYVPISYIDSLFVASSAVCITGLTTIDVSATFTPLGLLILGLLIQVGALGVMTFTSFFALFFSGGTSIYNQLMIKDMIYSKSINSLMPTLRYILLSTLMIEGIGAVMIYLSVHGELGMSLVDEVRFSLFTAVSAFCNAGFSNLPNGMANPMLLYGGQSIYIVLTFLVFAGSLGFPILVNLKDVAVQYGRRLVYRLSNVRDVSLPVHIYDVNTRIVLITTTLVFVCGAVTFYILESGNTMAGMSLYERIVQSAFNATTPRSSGFSSVSPGAFLDATLLVVMFQMWIGGASQSTAGGVKVNTFAAILVNLRSIVLGRERVVVFHRTISPGSIRRANAVVALSIISVFVLALVLILLEPQLPLKALLFEIVSAVFTVGTSLGVTPLLSTGSKLLLCAAMFLGRVGIISLLVGVHGHPKNLPARFPQENIIIN